MRLKKINWVVFAFSFTFLCIAYAVGLHNQNGFVRTFPYITNQWMYIDSNGEKTKGLLKIDNELYFFDEHTGKMLRGLKNVDNNTYYFNQDGKAAKGFIEINNEGYFFDKNHHLIKNKWKTYRADQHKRTSFFGEDGKMKIGTFTWKNKKYTTDSKGNVIYDLSQLQSGLEKILSKYEGQIGIYFEDLRTNSVININDKVMYPCCMVKIPALIEIYRQSELGNINLSDNRYYIENMITVSDNTCFNKLMSDLGGIEGLYKVNKLCLNAGMSYTQLHHGLRPGEYFFTDGGSNVSCPSDIGKLLKQLYEGKLVSKQSKEEVINLLSRCEDYTKLQSGLPYTIQFAHKTGDADAYHHDGGIVYLKDAEYILVVFTEDVFNFESLMQEVSEYTYNFQLKSNLF